MLRSMILASYDWFVGLVDDRRPRDRAEVLALADGSVFTGRQALTNKLVDALGGEREAVDWLGTKGVDKTLKVMEWKPKASNASLLFSEACRKEFGDMYEHLLAQLRGGQYPDSADCVMGLRFVQEVVAAAMWRCNMPVGGSLEQFAREFDRLDEPGECRRLHEWARAARIP